MNSAKNEKSISFGLIGMSGVGKTHWRRKITRSTGWEFLGADKMIEERLELKLQKHFKDTIAKNPQLYFSLSDTEKMAKWMGFPGDLTYRDRRDEYLHLENEVTNEILDRMESAPPGIHVIGDFSGSVIHLPRETQNRLGRIPSEIVYLESADANMKHLLENFTHDPKPIVWPEGVFHIVPGKTRDESLSECFPLLLEHRRRLYENLATITIHPEDLIGSDTVEEFFMRMFKSQLERKLISPYRESYRPFSYGKER